VWSAIGTMNLDNRSLAFNDESILVALDGSIGATMDSLFHDDLTRSVEIRLEVFRRRSWWTKLVERAAGLLENLL
jgi:cardiolipin synthase